MPVQPAISPLDREATARIEVGHTAISPVLARVLVAVFLFALAALPAIEWMGARWLVSAQQPRVWHHLLGVPQAIADRVAQGGRSGSSDSPDEHADLSAWSRVITVNRVILERLTAFETALEDESPVGRLLRPPAQQAMSGWLGVGNERVYAGRSGWLFYRQDVDYVTGPGFLDARQLARRARTNDELAQPVVPDPRPAILQFARDLEQRGITLVVMPTPVKPTVHPERLARASDRTAALMIHNSSYEAFVQGLRREGVLVFDPTDEMRRLRAESNAPAYLATDTHWRPETMERVAGALVAFLGEHAWLPAAPPGGYRVEPREARHMGDTTAMLDLPTGQTRYPPERVPLRFVVRQDGDPWRPSRDADILVLGDSFSNMYSLATMGWGEAAGLVEQTSYLLQRPIDRIVQNDQGAYATRAMLAREAEGPDDRLAGKRVVIWQFAARELAFGDWRLLPLPMTRAPQ